MHSCNANYYYDRQTRCHHIWNKPANPCPYRALKSPFFCKGQLDKAMESMLEILLHWLHVAQPMTVRTVLSEGREGLKYEGFFPFLSLKYIENYVLIQKYLITVSCYFLFFPFFPSIGSSDWEENVPHYKLHVSIVDGITHLPLPPFPFFYFSDSDSAKYDFCHRYDLSSVRIPRNFDAAMAQRPGELKQISCERPGKDSVQRHHIGANITTQWRHMQSYFMK